MIMVNPFKTTKVPSADPIKNGVTSEQDGNRSKFDVVLLSVRRLLSRGAVTNLANLIGRLHPADSARVMMHLSSSQEQCTVFELVEGERVRGEVLSELDAETILHVLEDWRNIPDDDVAYILGVLPEERAQEILLLMKTDESQGVAHLMTYPKGTAGSIMTTEFLSLPEETTAQDALHCLQQATKAETVFYIYTTDPNGHLTGVLSLRALLGVAPTASLKSFLTRDPISVAVETDQEEVARQVANYNLLAIPVVEKDGRLAGIITVDDVVDVIQEEDTKDMLKMAGASEEDAFMHISSLQAVRVRLPWLLTNLVGSLASGLILWYFRYAIQEVVALVTFIPVVAAMGGNVGLQSSST